MNKTPKDWPAASVEMRKVAELTPYANNSRTHSAQQVDQIAASIKEWGWTVPVLVDESGTLIAGHGRILAAQKLGIEEVPAMTATGWTDAQRKAYVIADNKLALNAGWDEDVLRLELEALGDLGFDLELTGFEGDQIDDLLVEIPEVDEPDTIGRANEHGRLERYLEQDVKMIRLTYHAEDYDHVYDAIEAYMKERGLSDMSSAVMSRFLQG